MLVCVLKIYSHHLENSGHPDTVYRVCVHYHHCSSHATAASYVPALFHPHTAPPDSSVESLRVTQLLNILRNLSFSQNQAKELINNYTVLRYIASRVCVCGCGWSEVCVCGVWVCGVGVGGVGVGGVKCVCLYV